MTISLNKVGRVLLAGCIALAACAASPTTPEQTTLTSTDSSEREAIIAAMKAELGRSMKKLEFKNYDTPYFIAYQLKEIETVSVVGKFGGVTASGGSRDRYLYTEVRVGDYGFDNYANIDNEAFRLQDYTLDKRAPLSQSPEALRGVLWQLTDEAYKKALSDYLTKKGGAVYATEDKTSVPSFSKEEPERWRGELATPTFDQAKYKKIVERMTAKMNAAKAMVDSSMDVSVTHVTRYLTTSEGTDIVDDQVVYSIQLSARVRADDGMSLENGRSFYARTVDELPEEAEIEASVDKMLVELEQLRQAPVIDPYTGPAILMPEASGVLFHEAVGHRLEGERQRNEEEGRTFKGREGKPVIPTFLSVVDDPTVAIWEETQLNGYYKFDDEGVPAQKAVLIEDGTLRGYLKSRTPIEGFESSNGHGRAHGVYKPMARMANLIVSAKATEQVDQAKLKEMLIAETKKQGKPFGLIIRDITGGSTNTSGYGYQAFKGASRMIYKVNPDTGEETLVRGAEIVGTPLVSINKIVAASTQTGVFNGYCGAESGYVPVSTVAPALLTTEIELQRSQSVTERPPLIPPPWEDASDEEK